MRQGCQMVSFRAKNSNLGKFWRYLDGKTDTYFMAIWNILRAFGIFYSHLVHFMFIWKKNPVLVSCTKKNLATLVCAVGVYCIVVTSSLATKEIEAMGRDVESRQGSG
jgi:hypothetical protein